MSAPVLLALPLTRHRREASGDRYCRHLVRYRAFGFDGLGLKVQNLQESPKPETLNHINSSRKRRKQMPCDDRKLHFGTVASFSLQTSNALFKLKSPYWGWVRPPRILQLRVCTREDLRSELPQHKIPLMLRPRSQVCISTRTPLEK